MISTTIYINWHTPQNSYTGVYRTHSQSSYDYHDSRAQTRHEMCMDTFHRGHGLFKPLTVKDDYDDTGIRWKPEAW